MAVTETTRESWGSRLGNSVRGVVVGLVLFVLGFPVLFKNEGNSVRTAKALNEGEGACVPLESIATIDPDMEGRLVHAIGKAETDDILSDDEFGISRTAIRLERSVEMYQWEESSHTTEKKNLGGSVTKETTYTYSKTWSQALIDSSDFKEAGHDNPAGMMYQSKDQRAQNVRFGAFRLNESQIARIGGEMELELGQDYQPPMANAQRLGNTIYIPNTASSQNSATNIRDVAMSPQIGDMRVTFSIVLPHDISIIAKQRGDSFVSYVAKTGKKVDLIANGAKDAAEMFAAARRGNAMFTWLGRLGGFLLMFIGLSMILKPLSVLGDVVPFIGTIIGIGAGIVAGLVSLICSLVTIAIAWIFYRPIIGIALLLVAGFFGWKLWQKRDAATTH